MRRWVLAAALAVASWPATAAVNPLFDFRIDTVDGGVSVASTCVNHASASIGGPTGGQLVLSDVPQAATIERAWLYWTILSTTAPAPMGSPTFDGAALVPTPIGEIAETPCYPNHAYTTAFRSEVTSLVRGNGTYQLAGFPGVGFDPGDLTEGATLIVLWSDPSVGRRSTLVLYDGVDATGGTGDVTTQTVTGLTVQAGDRVRLVAAIGNGQWFGPDHASLDGSDLLALDPNLLSGAICPPDGLYDHVDVDVTSLVGPGSTSTTLELYTTDDCYSLAAMGIVVESVSCPTIEPSALDRVPTAEPLRVGRGPGVLRLTWEETGADAQVWEGRIGRWYDHAPIACEVAGSTLDVAFPADDRYYLVAGCGPAASGGRNSLRAERPSALEASGSTCP